MNALEGRAKFTLTLRGEQTDLFNGKALTQRTCQTDDSQRNWWRGGSHFVSRSPFCDVIGRSPG
jgi:hypothetical protein